MQQYRLSFFSQLPEKYGEQLFLKKMLDKDKSNYLAPPISEQKTNFFLMVKFVNDVKGVVLNHNTSENVFKDTMAFIEYKNIMELLNTKDAVVI